MRKQLKSVRTPVCFLGIALIDSWIDCLPGRSRGTAESLSLVEHQWKGPSGRTQVGRSWSIWLRFF